MLRHLLSLFTICSLAAVSTGQSLADMFDDVSESVVVIGTVEQKVLGGGPQNVVTEQGLGSGVIISDEGMIWTAAHVVQIAEILKVKLKDGRIFDARVLSSNPATDLALIKIMGDPSDLKAAPIGDSDQSRIGDDIFVIGAPKGLEYSLSRGIISGRINDGTPFFGSPDAEFLQVDAAINPGNSGGPVFNMNGEVIGIASFILTESGGFEGIGFAATSNMARKDLSTHRIWGGIEGVSLDSTLAAALNVPQPGGYLIINIASRGLGAQIGLKGGTVPAIIEDRELLLGGDIILSLGGHELHDPSSNARIRNEIASLPSGSEVEIRFLRKGEVLKRTFTIMDN